MSEVQPTPEQDAQQLAEAVSAINNFVKSPTERKVQVVKHLIDKQIGSDETAILASIPGLTPELTEAVTDPLIEMIANAVVKALVKE